MGGVKMMQELVKVFIVLSLSGMLFQIFTA